MKNLDKQIKELENIEGVIDLALRSYQVARGLELHSVDSFSLDALPELMDDQDRMVHHAFGNLYAEFTQLVDDLKADQLKESDPDDQELDLINEQLTEMMQRHGFEDQSTGGGCWGWFKNLLPDGSMYLQITVGDSQLTYDNLADAHQKQVCACVYINGEWQDQTLQYLTFEELKKVLKEG